MFKVRTCPYTYTYCTHSKQHTFTRSYLAILKYYTVLLSLFENNVKRKNVIGHDNNKFKWHLSHTQTSPSS